MNLAKLFETQKALDERIVKEKGLEGQDLLPKKILALLTELGELSNEWRGFKFWSEDREPRTRKQVENCGFCTGAGMVVVGRVNNAPFHDMCPECNGEGGKFKNPLLEEYVDCLHFILSIGLEVGDDYFYLDPMVKPEKDITGQFNQVFKYAILITEDDYCSELYTAFIELGEMLGFTWNQIEQAYFEKNKINHERQNTNY